MSFPTSVTSTISHAHSGAIHALTFDSSDRYLLSGGQDRSIHLWNPKSSLRIKSYKLHAYEVLDIAVYKDNSKFASCGGDRTLFIWDVRTGETTARLSGHSARINSISLNDDDSVIASASFDATVNLWDLRSKSNKPIQNLRDAKDSVTSVHIKSYNILTGSIDGKIRMYDIRNGKLFTNVIGHPVTSSTFSQDANSVLVSSLDSTIRLIDRSTGSLLQSYSGHINSKFRVKSYFTNNDSMIMILSEDGIMYVWDLFSGELLHQLQNSERSQNIGLDANKSVNPEMGYSLAVCQSDPHFATTTLDGDIHIW